MDSGVGVYLDAIVSFVLCQQCYIQFLYTVSVSGYIYILYILRAPVYLVQLNCCNQAITHNCVSQFNFISMILLCWLCSSDCCSYFLIILFHVLSPAVNCGDPGTPRNGRRTGSSTTYNSVVTYTCNTGYTLTQGSNRRTCQSNGQWSGTAPRCNSKF